MRQRLLKTFIELIKINEVYPNEKEIKKYVANVFKNLKLPIKEDPFGNLIGYIPGKGQPVMLNTHLDIPEPVDNLDYKIEGNIIRATGKSILGADPKSGLAVLLELAKFVKEKNLKTQAVEFVFTRGEEAGLLGAINLDYSLIKSKIGLVIDEDGPCSNVVIQAPAYYRLDIEYEGKTVHPRDWKEGKNALESLCKVVAKLKQGEIKKGVLFNIGIIKGGTARNSVPGNAILQAELRSFNTAKVVKVGEELRQRFLEHAKKDGIKCKAEGVLEFSSYRLNRNHKLFKKLERTYKTVGMKPNYYKTYGGSDSNIFNSKGVTTVAIGSAYYLAHQYEEYVNLEEMETLLHFLLQFIKI